MPHQHPVLEIRISNIVACLEPAIGLLNDLHDNIKKNKDDCVQLLENIHKVLYAIVDLHIKSETPGSLPPATLDHVGKFMQTIHKIHAYVEAQQGGNKIKQFFRQNEMSTLLSDCYAGVQHAQEVFKIASGATILTSLKEAQITADNMHKELLKLISTVSDGTASDSASSMYHTFNSSQVSSKSLSMLPAKPKIFCGRDLELNQIVQILSQKLARISILGPGGMGKTSLAKAALHHPDVTAKYEHRFFVACDSATTSIDIAAGIGAHLGLKPGKDLTKPVMQNLSMQETCLLILDNLETTWEPLTSRHGVEELLALLADIDHLALIITMRGAERPAKVQWTHPFLPPLEPLSAEAAREMFIDIADDIHDTKEIDQLLHLTDHMPLAVDLIAHLVDYEGCSNVLTRWETERTSMLSAGHDHTSNLDASIGISLTSPRLTLVPGAKDLLSLLSILPEGISDVELLQSKFPISNIRACKVALLRTSLAFSDDNKRVKSLVPIREYMQYLHPPAPSLVQPLQKYFHALLDLESKYRGSYQAINTINQITQNLGNVHQVLLQGLHSQNPDLADNIKYAISFSNFYGQMTSNGQNILMEKIPHVLPKPCNHKLEVQFVTEVLNRPFPYKSTFNLEALVAQTISHFQYFKDPILECELETLYL
ncbi:P-loop containing nucleoside triphosphate hydrolase protein, partial [Mycena galericulata]